MRLGLEMYGDMGLEIWDWKASDHMSSARRLPNCLCESIARFLENPSGGVVFNQGIQSEKVIQLSKQKVGWSSRNPGGRTTGATPRKPR